MPQQLTTAVENNFTKGLITEFTGLNFPENAATDTDNCEYTLVGDVLRRRGIDLEINFGNVTIDRTDAAVSYYKWFNAGGDGNSQIFVLQVGGFLYFYLTSSATDAVPISNTRILSSVQLTAQSPLGSTIDPSTVECQYSDGNGYLFVYHPNLEPFYCTYLPDSGTITATTINVQIRDFQGIIEDAAGDSVRPTSSGNFHQYNLQNQGWVYSTPWSSLSQTTNIMGVGSKTFTVDAGLPVVIGNAAIAYGVIYYGLSTVVKANVYVEGLVTGYAGTQLTINVTSFSSNEGEACSSWSISPYNTNGQIATFKTAIGLYPSNSDVWWRFKTAAGVFDPATTVANTTLSSGPAPKGFYILDAFNQRRDILTGYNIPVITTLIRPKTGCWFQGRVWYAGLDASMQPPSYRSYSWTENIYFSQIIENTSQFGKCHQTNDPTSEDLFDLLPTDGGVIQIQGCGSVYKLVPVVNGLLVFAGNGVWFITGSQGIGFSATDYTITKISSIQSISSTSFVMVQGMPYFWNEEGIYAVQPSQQGMTVEPITVGTILSFYNAIPVQSKKYARGDYHPIDYVIQWCYRDTNESNITDRYEFNKILNYNIYNKAFYPYTVDIGQASINGVSYIVGPGGSNSPDPMFKYLVSVSAAGTYNFTFADQHDEDYVDWASVGVPVNYESFFITGYKIRGQAIKRFQPQYVQVASKSNGDASAYKIQGIWDYANDPNSGRWSNTQLVTNALSRYDIVLRRHKIRGHGYSLQLKFSSSDGLPFDIQGWSIVDTVNTGT